MNQRRNHRHVRKRFWKNEKKNIEKCEIVNAVIEQTFMALNGYIIKEEISKINDLSS